MKTIKLNEKQLNSIINKVLVGEAKKQPKTKMSKE